MDMATSMALSYAVNPTDLKPLYLALVMPNGRLLLVSLWVRVLGKYGSFVLTKCSLQPKRTISNNNYNQRQAQITVAQGIHVHLSTYTIGRELRRHRHIPAYLWVVFFMLLFWCGLNNEHISRSSDNATTTA